MNTQDTFLPPYPHAMTAQLLDSSGQPVGMAVPYDASDRIGLRLSAIDAPPASEWHPNAITPDDGYETVDINGNLRSWLEAHRHSDADPLFLLILNDTLELNQLCREDPALLSDHTFTLKPDEFWEHELTVNLGGQTVGAGPTFQGFKGKPSGNGYHARLYGKGIHRFRLCRMRDGKKGIAVTGPDANVRLHTDFCDIAGMSSRDGDACAGIYVNRGSLHMNETRITEIGHRRGEPRPQRSQAQLDHSVYLQWQSVGYISNMWTDTVNSHAIQLRGGGEVNGLVAKRTANGVLFGHDKDHIAPVDGYMQRAIIVNTEDIDPERQRTGVCVNTRRARLNVSNSILADERSAGLGSAFKLSHDTDLTLSGVRVQGINRLYDIDGHNVNISGDVGWSNFRDVDTIDANARKFQNADGSYSRYDTGGVQAAVTKPDSATLPDFNSMERPEPGKIGTLINSILTGATQ